MFRYQNQFHNTLYLSQSEFHLHLTFLFEQEFQHTYHKALPDFDRLQ